MLYNWFAVSNAKGLVYLVKNNVQDVGWRIGSDEDWTVLTDYIGGESVAGGLLKATGTDYWDSPNTDATDIYGFSARGHGIRRAEDAVYAELKKEEHFGQQQYTGRLSLIEGCF